MAVPLLIEIHQVTYQLRKFVAYNTALQSKHMQARKPIIEVMARMLARLQRLTLGISLSETSFVRRGFQIGKAETQQRLEKTGVTFVQGYHAALESLDLEELQFRLDAIELEFRGFAYEGAAMGITLLDYLLPWSRDRFRKFLSGPGEAHKYMLHVGAGWALARLRYPLKRFLVRFDPVLGWLAIDGYGFHEGYFRWRRYYEKMAMPKRLYGYQQRAFTQGLGRCLWFVNCGDPAGISDAISRFPLDSRADLWSGVGLACCYAGGIERQEIERVKWLGQSYTAQLAQGAAFAAAARHQAGNPAPHTELACEVLCGLSAENAARITHEAGRYLAPEGTEPAYEIWRRRVQKHFSREAAII